jgi:hypothetical protein
MNSVSSDSTKILVEKLSLARELATLRPELEHLRSQAASNQADLAGKLALQRQVSTLEVELETERRALKRASYKEKDGEKETTLQKEIHGLQKELAREKREKDKAQKEVGKGSPDLEARNAVLESRIEQLKSKLRETKDLLKETRVELAEVRESGTTAALSKESPARKNRKRSAQQISTDAAIGTPDGVAMRGKRLGVNKGKPEQTLLGEKSMFSITPFLNRTISAAPESPQEEIQAPLSDDDEVKTIGQEFTSPSTRSNANKPSVEAEIDVTRLSVHKSRIKQKSTEKNVLQKITSGSMNTKTALKTSRPVGTLQKVVEEEDEENVEPVVKDARADAKKPGVKAQQAATIQEVEPRKKKRKILGVARTLFDEDDAEATKRPVKIVLGPARSLGKGVATGHKATLQQPNFGAPGGFSPLKKDKRGMQASFLL